MVLLGSLYVHIYIYIYVAQGSLNRPQNVIGPCLEGDLGFGV